MKLREKDRENCPNESWKPDKERRKSFAVGLKSVLLERLEIQRENDNERLQE